MKDKDEHFFVTDVLNRLPSDLVPENKAWSSILSALTKLKTERNELAAHVERLRGLCEIYKRSLSTYGSHPIIEEQHERALSETPSQSLEAVKREWKAGFVDLARRNAEYGLGNTLAIDIDELYELAGL